MTITVGKTHSKLCAWAYNGVTCTVYLMEYAYVLYLCTGCIIVLRRYMWYIRPYCSGSVTDTGAALWFPSSSEGTIKGIGKIRRNKAWIWCIILGCICCGWFYLPPSLYLSILWICLSATAFEKSAFLTIKCFPQESHIRYIFMRRGNAAIVFVRHNFEMNKLKKTKKQQQPTNKQTDLNYLNYLLNTY